MGRVFCIGRNYAEHARELANPLPARPVVFLKPASSLVPAGGQVRFPTHGRELHHEVELVVRIGRAGHDVTESEAPAWVDAVTVGVDLTLRDLQKTLKAAGLPWEIAKSFDQSALIGEFVPLRPPLDLSDIDFRCSVNGAPRQAGNSGDMIFNVATVIAVLSEIWALVPGDLIFTGTPAGVGPLHPGDQIVATAEGIGSFAWDIVA
jgi:2-keto-4-pentenoate hydratase/2-oxohepta-3-ene-1,7-dioic acid hydratase in catechol pathway